MTLPFFTPDVDPGPDFAGLLRRQGRDPEARIADAASHPLTIMHGTPVSGNAASPPTRFAAALLRQQLPPVA